VNVVVWIFKWLYSCTRWRTVCSNCGSSSGY